MKKNILPILFLLFVFVTTTIADAETGEPKVVVSIKPIHSLVTGVMKGVAEPTLLVSGGGSPHGYVLRPSEASALANGKLIIWVGHALESFLQKPMQTLAKDARSIELLDVLESDLLPVREGGNWDEHNHNEHHHGHETADANPHLWLNPKLAQKIVSVTAEALGDLDAENRTRYADNANRLIERLAQLDQGLKTKLEAVKDSPYIVFHDAYQYFEEAYHLNAVGSLTVSPERKPGAKRILEIRDKIKSSGALCVFSEPQFEPRLVRTLTEGMNVRTGVLDPLGADLPAGEESYFMLMNNLADNLVKGLR